MLLLYTCMQKGREVHTRAVCLLLPYLYSVTQCFSLTLMFWTDLSNRIFSFLLSLLHSSLFGIPLVHFEFFLFFPLLLSTFVFSPRRTVILPHVFRLAPSSYPASLLGLYDLPFVTCRPCHLHLLHPRSSFSPTTSSPLRLWPRCQTCLALHSLAGHRPDAQPRAGRRGPVLYGLTGSP